MVQLLTVVNNMDLGLTIFIIISTCVLVGVFMRLTTQEKGPSISEWSYKRYADFYGSVQLNDPEFDNKIAKIKKLILEDNADDIEFIAKESGCEMEEVMMKINYLKNKKVLDNCYIDTANNKIVKCTEEDLKLVEKYKPYLYGSHLPLQEIIAVVPATTNSVEEKKDEVIKELRYLIDNKIVNGVTYNEVDEKLVYYSVEKHNKEKDFASIVCPKCGALNDVNYKSKAKCKYCGNIVENNLNAEDLKKAA